MKKVLVILVIMSMLTTIMVGCNETAEPVETEPAESEVAATEATEEAEEAVEVPAPEWPTEAVTIVCPSRAGGFADSHSRMLADYLQRTTGVAFAVINVTDGGGAAGSEQVKLSDPDGTTLLHFHTSFPISCYTGASDNDPETDFTLIAAAENGGYNALVCSADASWDTLEDLVKDAEARPGEIIWAAAAGGTSHFMLAMLEQDAGVTFKMVDGGGTGDRITGILGGTLEVTNIGISAAHQHVEAGDMKILAVIGDERDPVYSQYPTGIEQGYNFSWAGEFGLWGPADMDPALVEVINAALEGMAEDETALEQMSKLGSWYDYKNVEESEARMSEMYAQIKGLAKELGFID